MSVETYKKNLLTIIDSLIEKCIEHNLNRQVLAFNTIKHLIINDVIADEVY